MRQQSIRVVIVATSALIALACGRENTGDDTATSMTNDSAAGALAVPGSSIATTGGSADANVYAALATLNGGEVEDGNAAMHTASSSKVKQFAQQMVTDHGKLQKSVDSLAKAKNVTPAPGPVSSDLQQAHQQAADSLKTLTGPAFDRAYMAAQVQGHQKAIDVLHQLQTSAQDPDLRAAIGKAIPIVQGHLTKAQQIQKSLGTTA